MRLTCPNCAAQYEVPDDVIPEDGRDVQCSNCGHTWFQAKAEEEVEGPLQLEMPAEPEDESAFEPEDTLPDQEPVERPAEPAADADDQADADEPVAAQAAEEHAPRGLDPAVADILREEAEYESRRRSGGGELETQPDLGLSEPQDDAGRRAREAELRMARLRGEEPAPETAEGDTPRRGLLPDIDEINSTLRSASDRAGDRANAVGPALAEGGARRGGFARGFLLSVIVVVVLVLIYVNAPRIAAAVPQTAPALDGYVAAVDSGRMWLEGTLGAILPN